MPLLVHVTPRIDLLPNPRRHPHRRLALSAPVSTQSNKPSRNQVSTSERVCWIAGPFRSSLQMAGTKWSEERRTRLSAIHKARGTGKWMRGRTGPRGNAWKAQVGYRAIHVWIQSVLGKPTTCEHCGVTSLSPRHYHWANISRKYKRNTNDWIRLCARCHSAYDRHQIELPLKRRSSKLTKNAASRASPPPTSAGTAAKAVMS